MQNIAKVKGILLKKLFLQFTFNVSVTKSLDSPKEKKSETSLDKYWEI